MDPLTLLAMANGAVAAVKKGCQLYKDIKNAAGDVSEVLKDIDRQFAGKKVSKEQAKKIEEKREEVKALATLPGKNQLIAGIINTLQSPVRNVVGGLSGQLPAIISGLEAKAK